MQGRFLVRFVALGIAIVAVVVLLQQSGVFGNGSGEKVYAPRLPPGEPQVYRLPTLADPDQPAFAVVESDPEGQDSEAAGGHE